MKKMFGTLAQIWIFLFFDASLADWAREGVAHSFSCFGNTTKTKGISWALTKPGGKEIKFFQCDPILNIKCDAAFDRILYDANITVNGDSIQTDLLIKNVSLDMHQSLWKCFIDIGDSSFTINTTYDVFVFVLPEKQLCDNAVLDQEKSILIRCVAYKIFPATICDFFVNTNNTGPISVKNQNVTFNNVASGDTNYNNTECNLTLPGTYLGPGTHQFRVDVYPYFNIAENVTADMKKTSNYTEQIAIRQPKAMLRADCTNDYIKENESGVCTCYNENASFMPTHVVWYGGSSVNGTLNFTAKRPTSSFKQEFNCSLTSLNWTHQIPYRPNVAYPPDMFNMTLLDSVVNKCVDNVNISGTCLVSDSNPAPSINVIINGNSFNIDHNLNRSGNLSLYRFEEIFSETGFFNISCYFDNKKYLRFISTEAAVEGPPEIPKIFTILNGVTTTPSENILKVRKGNAIQCQSNGGFPNLKNLSLACGNETHSYSKNVSTEKDIATLTLNTTGLPSNITCKCIVQHESRCLRNTTTVKIMIEESESTIIDNDFEAIYIGVGVAFGGVVLAIFVILLLSQLRIRQLKNSASAIYEKLVSNSEIYLISKEKSEKTPTEYTNVVTTMTSALEFPKNFKAPA